LGGEGKEGLKKERWGGEHVKESLGMTDSDRGRHGKNVRMR